MSQDFLLRDQLVEHCMQTFSAWKERLESAFPNVRVSVVLQHEVAREMSEAKIMALCGAMIMDALPHQPDVIDLQIEFSDHDAPIYVNADLVWGDGDGYIELLLSDTPIVLDETSAAVVKMSLVEFYNAIVSCLQRRAPSRLVPNRVILNAKK